LGIDNVHIIAGDGAEGYDLAAIDIFVALRANDVERAWQKLFDRK